MQARDIMTREFVTVGPDTSAEYTPDVMAEGGFAALPVSTRAVRSVAPVADVVGVPRLSVDEQIRHELLRLVMSYSGESDAWRVEVAEGVATLQRHRGTPQTSVADEQRALTALARTVGGLVAVHVLPPAWQQKPATSHAHHGAARTSEVAR